VNRSWNPSSTPYLVRRSTDFDDKQPVAPMAAKPLPAGPSGEGVSGTGGVRQIDVMRHHQGAADG